MTLAAQRADSELRQRRDAQFSLVSVVCVAALGVQENPSDFVTEVPHSYFRGEHSLISAADSISHGFASAAEEAAYGDLPPELVESSNTHEMVDAAYTNPIDPAFMLETGSVEQQVESLEAIQEKAAHDAQEFDLGLIQMEEEVEPTATAPAVPTPAAPAAPAAPAPVAAPVAAPAAAPAAPVAPKKMIVVYPEAAPVAPVVPAPKLYVQPKWKSSKRASRRRAPKRKALKPRPGQRVLVNTPSGPVYVLYVAKKASAKAAAPKIAVKAPRRRRAAPKRVAKKARRAVRRAPRRRMSRRAARQARAARRAAQSAANLQYDPVTHTIIRHIHNHHYTRLPPPRKVWVINNGPSVADAEKWSAPDQRVETSASESTLQRAYLKLCKLQRALVAKWNARQRRSAAKSGAPSARHVLVRANLVRNKYRRASRNAKAQSRRQVNEASLLADKYARHLRHYAKAQRILASASQRLTQGTAAKRQSRAQSQRARGCKRARHPKTGRRGWMCPKGTKAPLPVRRRRAAAKRVPAASFSSRSVFDRAAAAAAAAKKSAPSPRFAQLRSEISSASSVDAETESAIAAAHEAESFTQSLEDERLMHEAELVAEDADVALAVANKKLEDSENEEFKF